MQQLIKLLATNLFTSPAVATIFISMFPVVEVKGAIPFGQSSQIWGARSLSPLLALLCSIAGGIIISSLLLFLLKYAFYFLNKNEKYTKLKEKIKTTFQSKLKKVENKNLFKVYLYLFIFVALPLPLTGLWSGCLIAALLNLDYLKSLLTLNLANIVAGSIISLVSFLSKDLSIYIFYFFLIAFILTALYYLVKILILNLKAKQ